MVEGMSQRLKDLRIQLGLSRKQVADLLGCSEMTIASYEQGVSQPPADTLMKLTYIYRTTSDYILGISPDTKMFFSSVSEEKQAELSSIFRQLVAFVEAQEQDCIEK